MTIETQPVNIKAAIIIEPGFKVKLNVEKFDLYLDAVVDSQVGMINISLFNTIFYMFEGFFQGVINLIFTKPRDLNWIL